MVAGEAYQGRGYHQRGDGVDDGSLLGHGVSEQVALAGHGPDGGGQLRAQ